MPHDERDQGGIENVRGRTMPQRRALVVRGGIEIAERVVGDQARAAGPTLVHDVVAGIDAQRALDAFELRAVADVDAHRADGDAGLAVDAVAAAFPALPLLVRPARLAAVARGRR